MEHGLRADLLALNSLLKPKEGDELKDYELDHSTTSSSATAAVTTPAQIGGPSKRKTSSAVATATKNTTKNDSNSSSNKDIWEEGEEATQGSFGAEDDPRPAPEYDIVYKQAVSAEDMYLGMSGRNPTTASCEDMVVHVLLPNTKYAEVELDVTDTFLDIRTPRNRLGLYLPHKVDSKNGTAKWDGSKARLSITLRMTRDYDFLRDGL